jgi:integrase
MAVKWKKTGSKGVRYYEHDSRKHGVRKDRYFAIRYSLNGRQTEEGLGWGSQGWTEKKASEERALLAVNRRRGEGPRTMAEKRSLDNTDRQEKAEKVEQEVRDSLTFKKLSLGDYMTHSRATKSPRTSEREQSLLTLWINPIVGPLPLKSVAPFHLERIKANLAKAGRTPRTIRYALAVVSQVFNYAIRHDLYAGANPIQKVKMPRADNRRLRFLNREEAATLLAELATKSPDVHDMAMVSLHTGMRAGEIFSLQWRDVDVDRGIMTLRDTKSGKTRPAFMTDAVKGVFTSREKGLPSELVFPDRNGKRMERISNTYHRAVEMLGLNEGIDDSRNKVVFHTLRHTYASWLVENGTDLYTVKELMGHSDLAMTARYAHLGENTLQAAVRRLDSTFQAQEKVVDMKGASHE